MIEKESPVHSPFVYTFFHTYSPSVDLALSPFEEKVLLEPRALLSSYERAARAASLGCEENLGVDVEQGVAAAG